MEPGPVIFTSHLGEIKNTHNSAYPCPKMPSNLTPEGLQAKGTSNSIASQG